MVAKAKDRFFLSYCPADAKTAERIIGILERLDYEVRSQASSRLGDPYLKSVEDIKTHELTVVLMTPNYLQSDWARLEIDEIKERLETMRVVPLYISDVPDAPDWLKGKIGYYIGKDFEDGMIELLGFLRWFFGRGLPMI